MKHVQQGQVIKVRDPLLKYVVLGPWEIRHSARDSTQFLQDHLVEIKEGISSNFIDASFVPQRGPLNVDLHIWTSHEFTPEDTKFGKHIDGFMLVQDSISEQSCERIKEWVTQLKQIYPTIPIVLVYREYLDPLSDEASQLQAVKEYAEQQSIKFITESRANPDFYNGDCPFEYLTELLLTRRAEQPLGSVSDAQKILDDCCSSLDKMTVDGLVTALTFLSEQENFGKNIPSDFCEKLYGFLLKKCSAAEIQAEWLQLFLGTAVLFEHYPTFTTRMVDDSVGIITRYLSTAGGETLLTDIETVFMSCPFLFFRDDSKLEEVLLKIIIEHCNGAKRLLDNFTYLPLRGKIARYVLELCEKERTFTGTDVEGLADATRDYIQTKRYDLRSQAESLDALQIHYLHLLFNHGNLELYEIIQLIAYFSACIGTADDPIVIAFFTIAEQCMQAEVAPERRALPIYIIHHLDLRHSGHYQQMAESLYQQFLESDDDKKVKHTVADYAKRHLSRTKWETSQPYKKQEPLLVAYRTAIYTAANIDKAELLRDLHAAIKLLIADGTSKGKLLNHQNIVSVILQIVTFPGLNLGVSTMEFMLETLLKFEANSQTWSYLFEYFRAPLRDAESVAAYRTRVTLGFAVTKHQLGVPWLAEIAELFLFKTTEFTTDAPDAESAESRAHVRTITYTSTMSLLSKTGETLRACRAEHPVRHYQVLTMMHDAQLFLASKTSGVQPSYVIPIMRAYLCAAKHDSDFAKNIEQQNVFIDLLSTLTPLERDQEIDQLTADEIATIMLLFSTRGSINHERISGLIAVVESTDLLRNLLDSPERQQKFSSALDIVLGSPLTDDQKAMLHFWLDHFALVSQEALRALGQTPLQQKWIAETARSLEIAYCSNKIYWIVYFETETPSELPAAEKLRALRFFETLLLRGITIAPIKINGEVISIHTLMIGQLGSVAQCKMSQEEREQAIALLRDVSQLLYINGTIETRQKLLAFIVSQFNGLLQDLELCASLYSVISLAKQDSETLEDYIHRLLCGFVINDIRNFLPNEQMLQKFIAWRLTLLQPTDHQDVYSYLTRFNDADYVAFSANPEKYFQDQARLHPQQYLGFLNQLARCYQSVSATPSPLFLVESIAEYLSLLVSHTAEPPQFILDAMQRRDVAFLDQLLKKLDQAATTRFMKRFAQSAKVQIAALFLHLSPEARDKLITAIIENDLHHEYFQALLEHHVATRLIDDENPCDEEKIKVIAESLYFFYQRMLDQNPDAEALGRTLTIICNLIQEALDSPRHYFDTHLYKHVLHMMIEMTLRKATATHPAITPVLANLLNAIVNSVDFQIRIVLHTNVLANRQQLFTSLLHPALSYGLEPKQMAELLGLVVIKRNYLLTESLLEAVKGLANPRVIADPALWSWDPMLAVVNAINGTRLIHLLLDCGFATNELRRLVHLVDNKEVLKMLVTQQVQDSEAKDHEIATLKQQIAELKAAQQATPSRGRTLSSSEEFTFFKPHSDEDENPATSSGIFRLAKNERS